MHNSLTSCQPKSTQPFLSEAPLPTLDSLNDDVIVQIFKLLSLSTLSQLSVVSSRFKLLTECDPLWQDIAHLLLFPKELESILPKITYRDHCKNLLLFKYEMKESNKTFALKLRDPSFVNHLIQMDLPNYQLLASPEITNLIALEDTKKLLFALPLSKRIDLHHVAQQTVGLTKFDILNCTDHVISFDSGRKLMINNQLTPTEFTLDDCQLFIFVSKGHLHIYNSDIGTSLIEDSHCPIEELANPLKICWINEEISLENESCVVS
jgi:F-box associated protein